MYISYHTEVSIFAGDGVSAPIEQEAMESAMDVYLPTAWWASSDVNVNDVVLEPSDTYRLVPVIYLGNARKAKQQLHQANNKRAFLHKYSRVAYLIAPGVQLLFLLTPKGTGVL